MNPIVTISATNRPGNYTSMALAIVRDALGERVSVDHFDGERLDLAFPGHGSTDDATKLQEAIRESSGVVIATPEYHGGLSSFCKLVIENLGFPSALAGKPVALVGVAAGRIGAIKSLEQLHSICSHVGALALPGPVSVAGVQNVFEKDGTCTDGGVEKALRGVAGALLAYIDRHVCPAYTLEAMVRETESPEARIRS